MTMEAPAQVPKPQSIEPLTDVYEGPEARVYRLDDSRAIVRLSYDGATGAVVIRPWSWTESEPTDSEYQGVIPPGDAKRINAWLLADPGAVAEMDFASLLLWSCRRGSLWHRKIADDGYQEDAQRVGPRAFNRFLIREVLQTWLHMGVKPQDAMRIEAVDATPPFLRVSCGQTRALVAALTEETETGNDPLLADWPRGVFGAIAEAKPRVEILGFAKA
jgi:hypothetical protein